MTAEVRRAAAAAERPGPERYDVVVIGGGFAGGGFATLLRRLRPGTRVLVVESGERHGRKVGEATVEVSAFFLHRVLGLYDLLSREHLPKHGLRYWFYDRPDRRLDEMSEVGTDRLPGLPTFQLDRSLIDEQLLGLAGAGGAEVLRPAKVVAADLGWPESRLRIALGGDQDGGDGGEGAEREVVARWVVDASGRHAFLARRLRLRKRVEEHPTAAVWARWDGVADLDGAGVLGADPRDPRMPHLRAARRLATNHFCGYGWWCWAIPLSGGQTSIGVVYNKELFELPAGDDLRERYLRFVTTQPGLAEILAGARMDEEDFLSYSHLPYTTSRYADLGWALIGDAASFLDPYYSPGLDHASISAYATARMIEDDLAGRLAAPAALEARLERHNDRFLRSYPRWLHALYVGKYEIMGDAELTGAAFMVDTALYYMGVVTPIYQKVDNLQDPVFGGADARTRWIWRATRGFNRRLVRLARFRRVAGVYGRRNSGWRGLSDPPGLRLGGLPMLFRGLAIWLRAEAGYLRHRLRHGRLDLSHPVPEAAAPALGTPAGAPT